MSKRVCFFLFLIFCLLSCRREDTLSFDPSNKLRFSSPGLSFDTVFTGVPSLLQSLTIYNDQTNAVLINSAHLKQGLFVVTAGGTPIANFANYKLAGKDSLLVFVKIQIPASQQPEPFFLQDSLLFELNGVQQGVSLIAYGQNVLRVQDSLIQGQVLWNSPLPYLVSQSLTIPGGSSLTISNGVKIYMHGLTGIHVNGSLIVNGTQLSPVLFASDRLEPTYATIPGQWQGISIQNGSSPSLINYAQIFNANTGVSILNASNGTGTAAQTSITNTVIENMSFNGIYCQGCSMRLLNSIVYNCGKALLEGEEGVSIDVKQSTLFNSNEFQFHSSPSVMIASSQTSTLFNLNNSILTGTLQNELSINGSTKATVLGNLLNADSSLYGKGNVYNEDPQFKNKEISDFHLSSTSSPAFQIGLPNSNLDPDWQYIQTDLDGNQRRPTPSAGAYEVY